ncbi:HNH endonuclease [Natronobacterium gregoryi]|uniref:HNH endonuclease n=2 Tax=Natronobacterium gregoryi TaxID=44930 RepID=L0AEY9_NATGS|nr:HNH endonuclease [Natronobacterium gregoryi]AFZ71605.1 restriction endonuclease [Natronobacterium gregoryi SP2]ELY66660.1 HNH endonuclease [Natronobacterium gregoryi SP2]PLK21372.1 HNH endonuclease [Natronobacterium gregoryi SP2]SFI80655.1 HNH endonuclease [Natronobacterium gregoryi]
MGSVGDEPPDDRGYGDGWEELRQQTLRRDGYTCTRCGADGRTLQAHHVVPRSQGGPDELENLLTLCRPCHGVIHQSNSSFDDVRDEAPLFPDRDTPESVARMREPSDGFCSRCGHEFEPDELVAWTDVPPADDTTSAPDHLTLCKPCAGFVLETVPACDREALTSNHRFGIHELSAWRLDAPVRPSVFAFSQVAVRREPRTYRERLVDDTPLRFVWNHVGIRWLTLVAIGYVLLVLAVASI